MWQAVMLESSDRPWQGRRFPREIPQQELENYFTEELDAAKPAVETYLDELNPDAVIAGPAFDAGRYNPNAYRLSQASPSSNGLR